MYRLVKPHLGVIVGLGHNSVDMDNLSNFKKYHELLNCILEDLDEVIYSSEGSCERSVMNMRSRAIDIMLETLVWLNDYEEIHEEI